MVKTLKFKPNLAKLVLDGTKTATWRLWDDKDLQVGDMVDFLETPSLAHFATAKIVKVIEKPMGALTEEDMLGHEKYSSDEEMYRVFTEDYRKEVNALTPVKIIWFEHITAE